MTSARGRVGVLLAVVVLAVGCGVPTGGAPERIDPSSVPYGLLDETPSTPRGPDVYFLRAGELVGVTRGASPRGGASRLRYVPAAVASGPTAEERMRGLRHVLPRGVMLSLTQLRTGRAVVDIRAGQNGLDIAGSLATASIVLTATSVPGVDTVTLVNRGALLPVRLPGGVRVARPLTREDYVILLAAGV
ncbi:MAG: GerMN domain-containing protein [Actinomycetes bacterium]